MNGLMTPGVSAGSKNVGATETCTAHVSCPAGAAAAPRGAPAMTTARASASAVNARRLTLLAAELRLALVDERARRFLEVLGEVQRAALRVDLGLPLHLGD